MKMQVSPVIAIMVIGVILVGAVALIWRNFTGQEQPPAKPPSGPLTLPPSQQGRRMPGGSFSGSAQPGNGGGH